jgi:hypothetical protein
MKNEIEEIERETEERRYSGMEAIKNDFEVNKSKITKVDSVAELSKDLLDSLKKKFANNKPAAKNVQFK